MCSPTCTKFGRESLNKEEIEGKRIIEIGSCIVNGSLRQIVESFRPVEYIGIDIRTGPGVDVMCSVDDLIDQFGKESFDGVICTELLEHVKDWRKAISNIKNTCKPNGMILITTRSYGFHYHAYPYDFWRYQPEDMEEIFADCIIEKIEYDTYCPGVFIKVKKPKNFFEKDISDHKLYSVIYNKRVNDIDEKTLKVFLKSKRPSLVRRICHFLIPSACRKRLKGKLFS